MTRCQTARFGMLPLPLSRASVGGTQLAAETGTWIAHAALMRVRNAPKQHAYCRDLGCGPARLRPWLFALAAVWQVGSGCGGATSIDWNRGGTIADASNQAPEMAIVGPEQPDASTVAETSSFVPQPEPGPEASVHASMDSSQRVDAHDMDDAEASVGARDAGTERGADAPVDTATEAPGSDVCSRVCGARSVCVAGTCIPAMRVFVSSAFYTGDLGGNPGADAKCRTLAIGAQLPGEWKAWVADMASSPGVRFTKAIVPYRLIDGTLVATSFAALASGGLAHAIDMDEMGRPFMPPSEVWTGSDVAGALSADGCVSFTSSLPTATFATQGHCDAVDATWTNAYQQYCDRNAHLYCFEQ